MPRGLSLAAACKRARPTMSDARAVGGGVDLSDHRVPVLLEPAVAARGNAL